MNIWQTLGTTIMAIGLMEVLMGKEVTTPDGAILGTASDVELDLMKDKIWVMVKHQERWRRIPSEQIASVTDKVALLDGWLPVCTEKKAEALV